MLKVNNLVKLFGTLRAVDGVSFSIEKGDIVGLLGPNGAGKTTTMRMLTGYYQPTDGIIEIDGVNIQKNLREIKSRIGYLPENNCTYVDMLVCDFLHFVSQARQLDASVVQRSIEYTVEVTGLQKYYYRPISQLSKGYKQRVGLAGTLIHDPDILILDEPTSGLDPNQIKEIQNLIISLATNKTIVLSTHILSEIEATCKQAIIIHDGKIVLDKSLNALSNLKEGVQIYNVTIKGQAHGIYDTFVKALDVSNEDVENLPDSKHTSLKLTLTQQTAEDVFQIAVKNNYVLLELVGVKHSLEDTFGQLTK